jgi:hypothetical protein
MSSLASSPTRDGVDALHRGDRTGVATHHRCSQTHEGNSRTPSEKQVSLRDPAPARVQVKSDQAVELLRPHFLGDYFINESVPPTNFADAHSVRGRQRPQIFHLTRGVHRCPHVIPMTCRPCQRACSPTSSSCLEVDVARPLVASAAGACQQSLSGGSRLRGSKASN